MMKLTTPSIAAQWLRGRVTGTLQTDSRKVSAGDGFIAWPGAATDGRHHVVDALNLRIRSLKRPVALLPQPILTSQPVSWMSWL